MAAGFDQHTAQEVIRARDETDPDAYLERLAVAGVTALAQNDARYPSRLREIDDAPPVPDVKGAWTDADEWSVAIVGTRKATAYGRMAAQELARASP